MYEAGAIVTGPEAGMVALVFCEYKKVNPRRRSATGGSNRAVRITNSLAQVPVQVEIQVPQAASAASLGGITGESRHNADAIEKLPKKFQGL